MPQQKPFPYLQAIYFALTKYIEQFRTFFLLALIWAGIWLATLLVPAVLLFGKNLPPNFLSEKVLITSVSKLPSLQALIAGTLLIALFLFRLYIYTYQLIRFSIALYKGKTLSLKELWIIPLGEFFRYAGARTLYLLKVALGALLFVPGFYFGSKYFFAGFSLIDKTANTIPEDTQLSTSLSEGLMWQMLFVFLVHYFLLTYPTYMVRGTGLVIMLLMRPIFTLAEVHLYFSLKSLMRPQPSDKEATPL